LTNDDDDILRAMADKRKEALQRSVKSAEIKWDNALQNILKPAEVGRPEDAWRQQIVFNLTKSDFSLARMTLDYYDLARREQLLKRLLSSALGVMVGGLGYLAVSPFFP